MRSLLALAPALIACASSPPRDPPADSGISPMFAPLFVEGATLHYAWRIGNAETGGEPGPARDLECKVEAVQRWGDLAATHIVCVDATDPESDEYEAGGLGMYWVATPAGIWSGYAEEEADARALVTDEPPFLSSSPVAAKQASTDAEGANVELEIKRDGAAWCRHDSNDAASMGYPSESTECFQRGRGLVKRYGLGRSGYMEDHLVLR